MKMYIGRYWVPFPRSEYGGMWSVIANNQDECVKHDIEQRKALSMCYRQHG